jgi:HSP20 family protein
MTLVKWEPFRDLITMQNRMSRLFDETLSRIWKEEELQRGVWTPLVDIADQGGEVVLKVDLPEMNQREIDIKVEENTLTIKGERKFIKETPGEHFLQIERPYGTFHRQFTLPQRIDQERIAATYKDGVLRVVLPKRKEAGLKQVSIEMK